MAEEKAASRPLLRSPARCRQPPPSRGQALVGWKIVHHDNIAALECRNQTLFHISKKHRSIHGSLEYERCDHRAMPQAGHESECFPMSVRRVADQPLSAQAAAAKPNHAGVRPRFVDKHQPGRVKHALLAHPTPTRADHVWAFLLHRVQSFF